MTDSDRDLLERAARAAGIKALRDPFGQWRNCSGMDPMMNMLAAPLWNPLADDGDALRLAVRLRINIEHISSMNRRSRGVSCYPTGRGDCGAIEDGVTDAATRRAITRAAAAMAGEA